MYNRAWVALGEDVRDVHEEFTSGQALRKYLVVVDVPCGFREHSCAKGGGILIQEMVFEQCGDFYDGNLLNGV
jgi:hypothetical protein